MKRTAKVIENEIEIVLDNIGGCYYDIERFDADEETRQTAYYELDVNRAELQKLRKELDEIET